MHENKPINLEGDKNMDKIILKTKKEMVIM